jgi:hypothetical protein
MNTPPPYVHCVGAGGDDVDHERVGYAGSFSLSWFAPGPVRLMVEHQGTTRWLGGAEFDSARVFDLQPGQQETGVVITESGIQCAMVLPGTAGLNGCLVRFRSARGREWVCFPTIQGATLALPNLGPGTYYLHFEPYRSGNGWISQWYDQADSLSAATPVTIPSEGVVVPITVHLVEGGSIRGTVTRHGVADMYDCRIVLTGTRPGIPPLSVPSDSDERSYQLTSLPDGDYKIGAYWYEDETLIWWPGTAHWDSAGVVSIRDHAQVTGIDINRP